MRFAIESVRDEQQYDLVSRLRKQVFSSEMGLNVPDLEYSAPPAGYHLMARAQPGGDLIAALSVIDTTDDHELHARYGLSFEDRVRVARYTQLAVLPSHRGLNLPLVLALEANYRFVMPGGFRFTWLVSDRRRIASSSFCRLLGFSPLAHTVMAEYGASCVLIRENRPAPFLSHDWATPECGNFESTHLFCERCTPCHLKQMHTRK